MSNIADKTQRLRRRKFSIRHRIKGTAERPRLTVYRSLNHIYAQIVDDETGRTLCAASSLKLGIPGGNIDAAAKVGAEIGAKAVAASIAQVAFDRNGRLYHGRIKALADAAREAGLDF